MHSRQELAPGRGPEPHQPVLRGRARRVARRGQPSIAEDVVKAITRFPEAEFMWSLTANWGGFGGMVDEGLEAARRARPSRCTARCSAPCRRCPGCASSRGSTRRCRRRASTTSSWCCRATARPSRCSRRPAPCVGAGWQSGKFLYVDTDLKIDLPEARVVIDREQVADLGLDLAGVGQELGTLLGGALRQPLQLLRPQLQGDPADRRSRPRDGRPAARPEDQDARRRSSCRSRPSPASRPSTAPRTLNRFQQRNAVQDLRRRATRA